MPYPPTHKTLVRARIVNGARALFNRRGFTEVSIDEIMAAAGLTRGGFYNHFKTKDALYAETLAAYALERRKRMPADRRKYGPGLAQQVLHQYVSRQHLEDRDGHCPLMALPSDVGRAGPAVKAAYTDIFEELAGLFEACLEEKDGSTARRRALAIAATCVGAMVLARTVDDPTLADEICAAARAMASDAIAPATQDVH